MWEERKRGCRGETCARTRTECCTRSSNPKNKIKYQPVKEAVRPMGQSAGLAPRGAPCSSGCGVRDDLHRIPLSPEVPHQQ